MSGPSEQNVEAWESAASEFDFLQQMEERLREEYAAMTWFSKFWYWRGGKNIRQRMRLTAKMQILYDLMYPERKEPT